MLKQSQLIISGEITMNKYQKMVTDAISVLFEYITLFAAVGVSVYIGWSSQYTEYDDSTLLLLIISLLAFISTSIASEKFFKLRKIENSVEDIREKQNNYHYSIDELFITRMNLTPLEDRFKNSSTIFISGGSLSRLSDEYYGFFEHKLQNNASIEVIIVKPDTMAAKLLSKSVVYEINDEKQYNKKIKESLNRFLRLKEKFGQNITIRLSDSVPPFSIIALNLEKADAVIQVELYSYAVPTRERIEFFVNKKDSGMFNFFTKQIKVLQEKSEIYDGLSQPNCRLQSEAM